MQARAGDDLGRRPSPALRAVRKPRRNPSGTFPSPYLPQHRTQQKSARLSHLRGTGRPNLRVAVCLTTATTACTLYTILQSTQSGRREVILCHYRAQGGGGAGGGARLKEVLDDIVTFVHFDVGVGVHLYATSASTLPCCPKGLCASSVCYTAHIL